MEKSVNRGMSLRVQRVIAYIVLILVSIMCLIWFYILIINATRSNAELGFGFSPLPSSHLIENWNNAIHGHLPIVSGLVNSIIVATCSAVLTTYASALTAYSIHAYKYRGKNAIFTFILAVMMIPTQVTALGFLKVIDVLKMRDTFWPLILPGIAAPIVFYYMKQYMDSTLPLDIVEAARIDGSGEFSTFNRIVLPIMKPALAVQGIFAFVTSWNNYFIPALVIDSPKNKTLPILIAELRSADFLKFDMGQVYVMILFSILPVVIVYLILSRNIVDGVAVGAVKG